jgi:hypothetical protein
MGFTGLVFGAIAAIWLVYLVPYFLRHRGEDLEASEAEVGFSAAVTIVTPGASLAEADPGTAEVSTPLTRRAQLRELTQIDRRAAQRRRRVLMVLLTGQLVVATLVLVQILLWWAALIPAGLILAFGVVARFSVRTMRAGLERRAAAIRECPAEDTIAISLSPADVAKHAHAVELTGPITPVGSLWEPIPITRPTYVSKPLPARTVRTVDLSAPVTAPALPVTADPITAPTTAEPAAQEDVG